MLNDPTSKCGVLYVDDEEKALKYFSIGFSQKFNVFTATSGAEGIEVLRREAGRIGVVLSDQRMPGMLGAEFLGTVREEFPYIVRILTTAYSDLESAIQAVNTGHIYQYVVKPLALPELGMVLRRAADYYYVLTERNELLALKMATLQRVICSDRVKWLLLSARSMDEAHQSAFRGALVALITGLPANLAKSAPDLRSFEIPVLVRGEYGNASRCLDWMEAARAAGEVAPEKLLQNFLAALAIHCDFSLDAAALEIDASSNAQLSLPACSPDALARGLFGLLVERETPEVSVRFLEALAALALANGSLKIAGAGGDAFSFSPRSESDANEAIGALYENFNASDISRL